jgi:UDP-GlcNAc:undecaprenyl-phosphate/decaprenyl-phosphate GlcNAc-1-phosphate transferase
MLTFAWLCLGFAACFGSLQLLLNSTFSDTFNDEPNHRSLHTVPTPRIGGVGIMMSVATVALVNILSEVPIRPSLNITLCCYFSLFLVSWLDDFRSLSVNLRLMAQLLVSCVWVCLVEPNDLPSIPSIPRWSIYILVVFGLVWSMNLFNFMDGSDGMAGSMAFIGFSAYLICIFVKGVPNAEPPLAGLAGAFFAFLFFNWPKASIFLGDCGSIPIGFIAAGIGIIGASLHWWGKLFPLLLFSMFWIDATVTLIIRIYQRKRFWKSHNEHWYQKAIRAGASHKKVVLIHMLCNVVIAALALSLEVVANFKNLYVQALTIFIVLSIVCSFGAWAELMFQKKFGP